MTAPSVTVLIDAYNYGRLIERAIVVYGAAESDVLRGGEGLLSRAPRPLILAEVQDIRTEPWGYRTKEIIEYFSEK